MNNYKDSMRKEFYETLEDREIKLEKRIEELEKVISYQKKQIRKLFNIIKPIKQQKET